MKHIPFLMFLSNYYLINRSIFFAFRAQKFPDFRLFSSITSSYRIVIYQWNARYTMKTYLSMTSSYRLKFDPIFKASKTAYFSGQNFYTIYKNFIWTCIYFSESSRQNWRQNHKTKSTKLFVTVLQKKTPRGAIHNALSNA